MHTLLFRVLPLPRALAAGAGLALLLMAAGAVAAARSAQAVSPITVDTLADGHNSSASSCASAAAGGKCTLRAAIERNEATAGGAAITLGVPGTINLALGQVIITKDVAITGPGAATSTVAGNGKERVFGIGPGAVVSLSGFTITGGVAGSTPDFPLGGGIANFGGLTLTNVDVQGNTAVDGGGIADFGTLNSTGGAFTSNTAHDAGGNLLIGAFEGPEDSLAVGSATVAEATIANGKSSLGGGAELDFGATATFTQSTFAGNVAGADDTGLGGAIANECGSLTLVNDTLDANQATDGFGGALFQVCGDNIDSAALPAAISRLRPASILTSRSRFAATGVATSVSPSPSAAPTPTPNPTPTPAAPRSDASIDFVTMAGNAAGTEDDAGGAGVYSAGDTSTVRLHDTIVANKAGGKNCVTTDGASTASQGYNLEDANDCGLAKTGDQTGADPKLGALASNGGPTQTMAITGPPAVDSADPQCDVKTDERGVTRPQGPRCDVGAYELQVATPATPTPLPSPPVTGQGPAGATPSLIALILALLALPLVGAGLLIARKRAA